MTDFLNFRNDSTNNDSTNKGGGGSWSASISPMDTDFASGLPNSLRSNSRSDLSIRDEILGLMDESTIPDKQKIIVDVLGGEVFLSGLVANLATRRTAQRLCDDVLGVNAVNNNLKVSDQAVKTVDELRSAKFPARQTPQVQKQINPPLDHPGPSH